MWDSRGPAGRDGDRTPVRRAGSACVPKLHAHRGGCETMSSDTNFTSRSEDAQPSPSRRSFLTRAAGISAVAVPILTLITSRKAHAQGAKKLTGLAAELINEVKSDEDQHVSIIKDLLDDDDNPLPIPI